MPHYKSLLDPGVFLGPADFAKEREVTVSRIVREEMPAREGEDKTASPMLYIKQRDGVEYPRKFKVPKSVLYGLSQLLGTDTDGWADKKITIFATWCMSFGEREECLRVRFPEQIEGQIRKWLKKRKASASCYMCDPPRPAQQQVPPANTPPKQTPPQQVAPQQAPPQQTGPTATNAEADSLVRLVQSRSKDKAGEIMARNGGDPAAIAAACKAYLDAEGIDYAGEGA